MLCPFPVHVYLYRPIEGIASLLQMAADSLRHPNGHLYYLGADLFGVLGYELSTSTKNNTSDNRTVIGYISPTQCEKCVLHYQVA